ENNLVLPYHLLKIAIFEESKSLFENRSIIIDKWRNEAYQMTEEEVKNQYPPTGMSLSFKALFLLITEGLYSRKPITKSMIKDAVISYSGKIISTIWEFLYTEFPEEIKTSLNEETIEQTRENDYLITSMDNDFHMLRKIVAKPEEFKERGTGQLAAELFD